MGYIDSGSDINLDLSDIRRHLKLYFVLFIATQLDIIELFWDGDVVDLVNCYKCYFCILK